MWKQKYGTILLAIAVIFSSAALADSEKVIRAKLKELMPGLAPDRVEVSPIAGIYEVYFGTRILYITEDAKYVIQGSILDTDTREDISEAKLAKARLDVLKDVSEKEMIVFAPKKSKHTVTVFTDIDCPYCRKMHLEVSKLNEEGVTVRYLLMPRAGKGSKSYKKAIWTWCAEDSSDALTRIKAGEKIEQRECKEHPVDKHLALAEILGVTGTPSIILETGKMVPGYVPADKLLKRIEQDKSAE